jgi:hypothetical protein
MPAPVWGPRLLITGLVGVVLGLWLVSVQLRRSIAADTAAGALRAEALARQKEILLELRALRAEVRAMQEVPR